MKHVIMAPLISLDLWTQTFGSFGFCLNSLYFALFQINPNFLPEEEWLPQSSLSPGLMPTIPMLNQAMDCPPVPDSGRVSPSVSLITSAVMQTQFCWKFSWANKTRSVFMPKDHKIFWKRSSLPLINRIRLSLVATSYLLPKGKKCTVKNYLIIFGTGTV